MFSVLFTTFDGLIVYDVEFNIWYHSYDFLNINNRVLWDVVFNDNQIYFSSSRKGGLSKNIDGRTGSYFYDLWSIKWDKKRKNCKKLHGEEIPSCIVEYVSLNHPDDKILHTRTLRTKDGDVLHLVKLDEIGILKFNEDCELLD